MTDRAERRGLFSQWPHMTYWIGRFSTDGYGENETPETRVPAPLTLSNVNTSLVTDGPWKGYHTVALDIDHPAVLIPSSTPGRFHLYIDHPMPWERYEAVLKALGDAGVIEPGYAGASIKRGHTALRMPWVRKGDDVEPQVVIDPWAKQPAALTENPPF